MLFSFIIVVKNCNCLKQDGKQSDLLIPQQQQQQPEKQLELEQQQQQQLILENEEPAGTDTQQKNVKKELNNQILPQPQNNSNENIEKDNENNKKDNENNKKLPDDNPTKSINNQSQGPKPKHVEFPDSIARGFYIVVGIGFVAILYITYRSFR